MSAADPADPPVEALETSRPLGSDNVGHDVLSRPLHGRRMSLGVGARLVALGPPLFDVVPAPGIADATPSTPSCRG